MSDEFNGLRQELFTRGMGVEEGKSTGTTGCTVRYRAKLRETVYREREKERKKKKNMQLTWHDDR